MVAQALQKHYNPISGWLCPAVTLAPQLTMHVRKQTSQRHHELMSLQAGCCLSEHSSLIHIELQIEHVTMISFFRHTLSTGCLTQPSTPPNLLQQNLIPQVGFLRCHSHCCKSQFNPQPASLCCQMQTA